MDARNTASTSLRGLRRGLRPRHSNAAVWLVVAALGNGCGGSNAPADGSGGGGATSSGAAGGSAVPTIADALASECPDANWGEGVPKGGDLHKHTLSAPEAVCNDGSPAVMYVRAASSDAESANWVFHLQGGGSCAADYDKCAARWCGTDYDRGKMSSTKTPTTMAGLGIMARDGKNAFGNANQVFIYYCSSDTWAGDNGDAVLTSTVEPEKSYRMAIRGRGIVKAALDALEKPGLASDDGDVTMPSLSTATEVIFTGTSAGAGGVAFNLDFVAERLSGNGTKVFGVSDANFSPDLATIAEEPVMKPEVADTIEQVSRTSWERAFVAAYQAPLDASCLAAHGAGSDAWLCGNTGHLLLHHVTTPYFARQDLTDPVISQSVIGSGGKMGDYAKATLATLELVKSGAATSEEKRSREPGIYAPQCGQHVALTSTAWFSTTTLGDGAGKVSFETALASWLAGSSVFLVDTLPSTLADCSAVTDAKD